MRKIGERCWMWNNTTNAPAEYEVIARNHSWLRWKAIDGGAEIKTNGNQGYASREKCLSGRCKQLALLVSGLFGPSQKHDWLECYRLIGLVIGINEQSALAAERARCAKVLTDRADRLDAEIKRLVELNVPDCVLRVCKSKREDEAKLLRELAAEIEKDAGASDS